MRTSSPGSRPLFSVIDSAPLSNYYAPRSIEGCQVDVKAGLEAIGHAQVGIGTINGLP
jgi:hypothetical protein